MRWFLLTKGIVHLLVKKIRYLYLVVFFKICSEIRNTVGKHCSNNLRKMVALKNIAERKRCFIVATGPSLSPEDLEKIKGEISFGVNSIFLMYEKTDWRPSYYVCTDAPYFKRIQQEYGIIAEKLSKYDIFLNSKSKKISKLFNETQNTHYIHFSSWNRAYDFENYQFSDNIVSGLYAFGTVTTVTMAIAMYMGYKEIYLIGADCSNLNKHFINDVTDVDKDDEYVKNVIHAQLRGYEIMKHEAEIRGVNVYNATRGGALEVFKRVNLDEVLKGETK